MDYKNGKIYKLVNDISDDCYYGSTCQSLAKRKCSHKSNFKRWKAGKYGYNTSLKLFEDNANVDIVLVEEYPCDNKMQLYARERFYIENNDCLNKCIPTRTKKEWRKEYRQQNKDKIVEKKKEYYQKNKDKLAEQKKEYYQKNKDKLAEYNKEYQQKNKDKIAEQKKEYYQKNKDKLAEIVTCDCGSEIIRTYLAQHKRTQKHIKRMESEDI